nr:LysR family transcriptional regulator [Halomonas socia]
MECQSYTKAAEKLGMTQPAVSHSIQSLERVVGGALIVKKANSIGVTALGELVLNSAKNILDEVGVLNRQIARYEGVAEKAIKIGAIPSAIHGNLNVAIELFTQQYPDSISLVLEGVEEEVKEWVESGIVDVGVTTDVSQLNPAYWRQHFFWKPLYKDEVLAILPKHHSLAIEESLTVEKLSEYPLVMSSGGCEALIYQIFSSSLEEIDTFQVDFWVRDTSTLLQMVSGDVGISLVPESAIKSHTTYDVLSKHLSPRIERNVIAFWPRKSPLCEISEKFIDQVRALNTPVLD